jgi:hypothetical protein
VFAFLKVWVRAWMSGAYISLFNLVGMKLRNVVPKLIVDARIRAVKAACRQHRPARGALPRRRRRHQRRPGAHRGGQGEHRAVVPARAAIDLAGRDVYDAVRTSVNPKVIDCPDPAKGANMLDAVAKDGIRLLVKARVTVRANLARLVGGATEDTSSPASAKASCRPSALLPATRTCWKTPTRSARRCSTAGWIRRPPSKSCPSTSPTSPVAGVSGVREVANVGALLETERAEADKKLRQAEAEGRAPPPWPPNRKTARSSRPSRPTSSPPKPDSQSHRHGLKEGKLA